MGLLSRLKLLYLLYFSKPPADRVLYRAIRRSQPRKIVVLGLGTAGRVLRMIEVARLLVPIRELHLTVIDPFEAQPADRSAISLKQAFQLLRGTGVRVRLVPGEPLEGLMRAANDLGQVDLLVFSAGTVPGEMARAWFFVPRLLHNRTAIYLEKAQPDGPGTFQSMPQADIAALASAALRRRAA